MKKLICAKDVEAAAKQGQKTVFTDRDTIITPMAKDAASALGVAIAENRQKQQGCQDGQVDSELIYNALRAMASRGMLQGIFDGSQAKMPYLSEHHPAGFKLVRGDSVKLDALDTGNSSNKVFCQELIGSGDRSSMNAGFMTIERCNFDWNVTCEEIYYIVEGTLTVTIDGKTFTAYPGDSLYAPKGVQVNWGAPNKVKVFYATF
ncbi:MAG: cupin domain-containing protein [Clostridiales bacterium]|nr:cupin domain-containing protein [Clostridiales bacterium]